MDSTSVIIICITQHMLKDAFKIYVYDVGEYAELQKLASGASFCKDNQWGFEVLLHWYYSID